MTIEEKAKAYDEAIAKAQKELQSCGSKDCDAARQIYRFFPELQESEDEKVKRIIHSISNKISFHLHDIFTEEEFQCFDAWSNAWLKMQGNTLKEVTYTQEVIAWLENRSNTSKEVTYTQEVETGNGNIKALVTDKQSNRGMTREDILKIVDKCYGYAWLEFKMAEPNTPDEYITKTLMKVFDYIGRALREEQQ